jgi:hypothetical protein
MFAGRSALVAVNRFVTPVPLIGTAHGHPAAMAGAPLVVAAIPMGGLLLLAQQQIFRLALARAREATSVPAHYRRFLASMN